MLMGILGLVEEFDRARSIVSTLIPPRSPAPAESAASPEDLSSQPRSGIRYAR